MEIQRLFVSRNEQMVIKSKVSQKNKVKDETSKGVCMRKGFIITYFSLLDRLDENSFCGGLFSFILSVGVGLSSLIRLPNVPTYFILSRKET